MNRNEWIKQAARLQVLQQAFALVTVLRAQAPTSSKAGDKAVVTADGQIHGWIGGGCAQPTVIKAVRRALLDGQPCTIRIAPSSESAERDLGEVLEFGMACHSGGTLELFIDPIMPLSTLAVVGDSPVARALVSLAPRVGLRVAVVAQGAQAADFADADTVVGTDDAAAVAAQLASTPFVVVATQGRRDMQGLTAALALQPQGLWFVASAKKAKVLLDSLLASGEDPSAVARIVAPAGEFIGAQTPEEIALSVLASVVAARRGRSTQTEPLSAVASDTQALPLSQAATAMQQTTAPVVVKSCCGSGLKNKVALDDAQAATSPGSAALELASPTSVSTQSSCCGG